MILRSPLTIGQSACPEEEIIFDCIVEGSHILIWNSNEYIGAGSGAQLEFSSRNSIGSRVISQVDSHVFAQLTKNADKGGTVMLQSTLRIVSTRNSTIKCLTLDPGSTGSANLTVLGPSKCSYSSPQHTNFLLAYIMLAVYLMFIILYIIDPPGVPHNPRATDIKALTSPQDCVLSIEWNSPIDTNGENIAKYAVRLSQDSSIPEINTTSTIYQFPHPCNDKRINITISAIDRCGREGISTGYFRPMSQVTEPPSPQPPNPSA